MSESNMNVNEIEHDAPAPKPKKKKVIKRAKRKTLVEAKPVVGGEYAGISATQCCADCTETRCVITTVGVCGHPYKVNLHNAGPKTKVRIMQVKKLLKHQMVDADKL